MGDYEYAGTARLQDVCSGEVHRRGPLDEDTRDGSTLMLDARGLIGKHRAKGVLVDTNLLVLFLAGTVNRQRIANFKRIGGFSIEDYELLVGLIRWSAG